MSRPKISATIITLNEEDNLPSAIKSLHWVDEIIVVDSGSTDKTAEKAREMGARVLQNPWPGYGKQKNFAQDHASFDWVLNLDADERVTEELREEIENELILAENGTSSARGFYVPRKTFYLGKWIKKGGWYPNYVLRLAHKPSSRWTEPHVHERLDVQGETKHLKNPLHHFTFSSIQDQVLTNLRYSHSGYRDLLKKGNGPSFFKLIWKPIGKFIETYLIKRGCLDGLPGFIISVNAAHSIFLKYAYLFEAEIEKKKNETSHR